MGNATLNGTPFRIDPVSVAWDYTIKAVETKTVGGKVIQIIGSELGDITVSGTFGVGGWKEQDAFLNRMIAIGINQAGGASAPIPFVYPRMSWSFQVYLKSFTQTGASTSVALANNVPAPKWTLTFFLAADSSTGANGLAGLHTISQDAFIARLAAGIGWAGLNRYNGLIGFQEISGVLSNAQVSSVKEYVEQSTGISNTGNANQ